MPVLIGGMGLGAEVGYWYLVQRKLQHAADLAAYAAAVRLAEEDEQETLERVAGYIAAESGFTVAIGTIAVNNPPLSGPNVGDEEMVEVILTEGHPRFFSALFGSEPVEVQGRAVAAISIPKICVLALSPTASNALHAQGSSSMEFQGCSIASNSTSNSSLRTEGNPTVRADCVYGSGDYRRNGPGSITTTVCESIETQHEPFPDPYVDVTFPSAAGPCVAGNVSGGTVTTSGTLANGVGFKRFCSLTLSGSVSFEPGIYIVDGNITNDGSGTVSGAGVTFAVSGNVTLSSSMAINLTAPQSGPYRGMIFFGDRDATVETHTITGSTSSTYQGAVYFPTGNLTFTGSSSVTNGCTQIIARTIFFTGSSEIRGSCGGSGTRTIAAPGGSKSLVE